MTKSLNSNFKRQKPSNRSAKDLIDGILSGNKADLAQGITLLESSKPEHHILADEIINACLPHSGKSIRVGITGVPGVGKSTFIESFGNHLIDQGYKLAVLAIDPSSQKSGGSILGDKTRMETLVRKEEAFVRPSPSKGSLGGVAKATRESIILCEAAGYDFIIIETVGVGQSEIAVRGMVDFFLLLMLAGAGDELQGIKRGIMEMADALVITKADIEEPRKVKTAMAEYRNAMHLFPAHESEWIPKVSSCSAIAGAGIAEIEETILSYSNATKINGYFDQNRTQQDLKWMDERINEMILESIKNRPEYQSLRSELSAKITERKISPFSAAEYIFDILWKK